MRAGYRALPASGRVSMREALIVSVFLSLAGVLVYIGLLLWAAREDGRDQARRDRHLRRD